MPKLNEDQVKNWKGRVEVARRYMKRYGDQNDRWRTNIRAMAGDFDSKNLLGKDAVDVNLVRSNIDTTLPPLWINDPFVTVSPTKPRSELANGETIDNVLNAEFAEAEINYWFRELGIKGVIKSAVIDSEATNHGYAYVGFTKDKGDLVNKNGERIEPNPLVKMRHPFVRRISPRDVLVPPGFFKFEDAPWVALIFRANVKDARERYGLQENELHADKRLFNYQHDEQPADGPLSTELNEYLNTDDNGLVEIQCVWDKRTRMVYEFTDGYKEALDEYKWPVEVEGFPVCHMSPVEIPDEFYGTPPLSYYLPQNIELNAARTATRKRENQTKSVIFALGDIAEEIKEAYASAEDGDVISIPSEDPATDDIRRKMTIDPGLPPHTSAYAYGSTQIQDMQMLMGMGLQQRGQGDPNAPTATSSANIEKWIVVRQTNRGDVVRDFILDIAKKLWMILKQFPDEQRDRLVPGRLPGMEKRLVYRLSDLEGEFDFKMDLSAMLSENPAARVARAVGNYNLMRADPEVEPTQLILDIYASQNEQQPERYLKKLMTPEEELIRFMQGLPATANERDDHPTHLQSHRVDMQKLDQALDQVGAESPMGEKVRVAIILLASHINDHLRLVAEIMGGKGAKAGSPVAENMLRGQVAASQGAGETQAELGGQPLGSETAQTPGGLSIQ